MPRNIIICFDGTSNEFGKTNTNVVRLVQVLDRDQQKQRLYYDPGVGTLPEPGFVTKVGRKFSDLMGLAFGTGLLRKVGEAYSFLMEVWEPGDNVFVFGFSRGAYSARVLAALLHTFGLLPSGNQNLLPYLIRLFKGVRSERKTAGNGIGPWLKLSDSFRWTFARQVTVGDQERRFPVHFVGVWDTVSSVGWVWNPDSFPYTAANPSIGAIRHAVSIDERRFFFRQNLFKKLANQNFKEVWFAGSHCDVGGGYPETEGLLSTPKYAGAWRCAFEWMVEEATECGLFVDPSRLATVLDRKPPCPAPWTETIHDSLVLKWWIGEFVPKPVWNSTTKTKHLQCGRGRTREIPRGSNGAMIHKSALRRLQESSPAYHPTNIDDTFQSRVKSLTTVPDYLVYE